MEAPETETETETAAEIVCSDQQRFWACLREHYSAYGITTTWESRPGVRWPAGSKKVNPHALYVEISGRGGFFHASADKRNWWEVAKIVGVPPGLAGTLSYQVKQLYAERLL
ncbi:uncharacterized protein GIQ15_00820 [Arthroderma uncinatum]|uniref:uncharacterized protein n=1 Tax=Arthroderma uncinatum TaxID=74035 RepID=UPI00144AABE4|nr:uncharacterized protein GIQ15_00820 [Arthroderma uncinatum]KAF3491303.1 hypothetical protein GIQ15_00820 [Arthroderma uncinatum]